MPYATYQTTVAAPLNLLWELLIDKIENPQHYVPGITGVKILSKEAEVVIREMTTAQFTVKEKITWNEETREVIFTLLEHPHFQGQVLNKIWVNDDREQPIALEFTLDWQPLQPEQSNLDMSAAIKQAVLQTKELAEAKAKEK